MMYSLLIANAFVTMSSILIIQPGTREKNNCLPYCSFSRGARAGFLAHPFYIHTYCSFKNVPRV
jgi:hypothetical protein